MDIEIFEDQTGFMMFPEKALEGAPSKNMDIVKLFDNKIDLCITNREDGLEVICYLLVQRGQERAIGCYIIGKDQYRSNTFVDFKKAAKDALHNIGFEYHRDHTENMVFEHMEKFDLDGHAHEDIDFIVAVRKSEERVGYKGGNIEEIAIFCRRILKRINNIKIVISTIESNMGHVNILRSNTYDERLSPTVQGKQILDRQRFKVEQIRIEEKRRLLEEKRRLLEEKRRLEEDENKKKERELIDDKMGQGIALVEKGLDIKRKAGYGEVVINSDIRTINFFINGQAPSFPHDEEEKNENEHLDEEGRFKKAEKTRQGEDGNYKIKEGSLIVREALTSKRQYGYTELEIGSDIRIHNSCITIRPVTPPDKSGKQEKLFEGPTRDIFDKLPDVKGDIINKLPHIPYLYIAILAIVGLLASSWVYGFPLGLKDMLGNNPEKVPVIVETPLPTTSPSPVAILVPNQNANVAIAEIPIQTTPNMFENVSVTGNNTTELTGGKMSDANIDNTTGKKVNTTGNIGNNVTGNTSNSSNSSNNVSGSGVLIPT